jgi:hypothetical protein
MRAVDRYVIRFVIAFSTASFLVGLLSWSRGSGTGTIPMASLALLMHLVVHALFGAAVALPTGRRGPIFTMAISAVLIDVDHLASYLGWPVPPRTSHSLFFLVLAPCLMGALARRGWLGNAVSPLMTSSLAFSTVLAHLAWDALSGGETRVPLWLPFSNAPFIMTAAVGLGLEVMAVAIISAAVLADRRRARSRRRLSQSLSI